ncbi:MAG: pyridoxamine 5'-phosphate oxidase family protein [Propionicimonas sp.]
MDAKAHNTPLSAQECRQLLAGCDLGRVAWATPDTVVVLPVSYVLVGERIAFRTAPGSLLSKLVEPQRVAFEIDDLDPETRTGWSVLVQGTSGPGEPAQGALVQPWAPGDRPVTVLIEPLVYTGRAIAAG